MFAPAQVVTLDDGTALELGSAYGERPLALVFLRHLGCIFCREIVARLRDHPEANILFVATERAEECSVFRVRMESPHRIISDPSRTLYAAFGLGRTGFAGAVSPRTIQRGIQALRAGARQGLPTGDPLSLGGAFVVDRAGQVAWEYRSRDIADNPQSGEILLALADAALADEGKGEVKSYPFAGIAQR